MGMEMTDDEKEFQAWFINQPIPPSMWMNPGVKQWMRKAWLEGRRMLGLIRREKMMTLNDAIEERDQLGYSTQETADWLIERVTELEAEVSRVKEKKPHCQCGESFVRITMGGDLYWYCQRCREYRRIREEGEE